MRISQDIIPFSFSSHSSRSDKAAVSLRKAAHPQAKRAHISKNVHFARQTVYNSPKPTRLEYCLYFLSLSILLLGWHCRFHSHYDLYTPAFTYKHFITLSFRELTRRYRHFSEAVRGLTALENFYPDLPDPRTRVVICIAVRHRIWLGLP